VISKIAAAVVLEFATQQYIHITVCIIIYIGIHIYVYIYMYAYMHICIYVYIVCIHTQTYNIYIYLCIRTCINSHIRFVTYISRILVIHDKHELGGRARVHTCTHTYFLSDIHTYTSMCTHTKTHIHTQTHIFAW